MWRSESPSERNTQQSNNQESSKIRKNQSIPLPKKLIKIYTTPGYFLSLDYSCARKSLLLPANDKPQRYYMNL